MYGIAKCGHSMKFTEQGLPVVLLTMPHKVVLTLKCDQKLMSCTFS